VSFMAMRDWANSIPSTQEKRATGPYQAAAEEEPRQEVEADRHQGSEEDSHDPPGKGELANVDLGHVAVRSESEQVLAVGVGI